MITVYTIDYHVAAPEGQQGKTEERVLHWARIRRHTAVRKDGHDYIVYVPQHVRREIGEGEVLRLAEDFQGPILDQHYRPYQRATESLETAKTWLRAHLAEQADRLCGHNEEAADMEISDRHIRTVGKAVAAFREGAAMADYPVVDAWTFEPVPA